MNNADLPTIQSPDEHRKQIDLSVELSNLESGHNRLLSELGGNLIHAEEIARILAADLNPSDHDGICTLLKWQEKSANFSEIDNSSLIDRQEKKDLTSLFPAVQIPHAVQLSYLQNQWMTAEHLRFCRTLAEIIRPEFQPLVTQLFGATEPLIKEARSHVIYQKNIYADEAFLRFARELPDIKAHYA
ncbi:MAG: hypothetical protein SOT28_10895, partial [Fusicatenibacter sp.]|nr:hypothetical protein [Fusicatenibacter sp.]